MMRFATSFMLAGAVSTLATVACAQDPAFPPRRSGLWSVQTITDKPDGGPKFTAQMCIDAATDRDLMDFGLRMSKDTCKRYDVTRSGQSWTINSECSIGPVKSKSRTHITGDFQSRVSIRTEGTTEGMPVGGSGPQEMRMTQEARWVSATCGNGMVPGDIALEGGMKINVNQMKQLQKMLPNLQIR